MATPKPKRPTTPKRVQSGTNRATGPQPKKPAKSQRNYGNMRADEIKQEQRTGVKASPTAWDRYQKIKNNYENYEAPKPRRGTGGRR